MSFLRELWRWSLRIALGLLVLCALGALGVYFTVRHFERGLPSTADLKTNYRPSQITRVLARDGSVLATLFTERRTVIPFSEIPNHVKLAFLAAEDANFYQHRGLDYVGMVRAMFKNLRAGRTRMGASTITQQVVKNVLLDPERTYTRKIKETILARRLEEELSKDEIFSLYINHIFLGHGRYGIEEAARYYFGKKARELSLPEAALLAGIQPAPERYSPRRDETRALTRRKYVLDQMLAKGFVTQDLYEREVDAPLHLAPAAEGESELCPEVVAYAKKVLDDVAGESAARGGFVIETTIDPVLQAGARRAVRENLDAYLTRQKLEPPYLAPSRKLWGAPFTEGVPKPNRIYVGKVSALDDVTGIVEVQVGSLTGRLKLADEERYNPKRLPPTEFTKLGALLRVSPLSSPAEGNDTVPVRLELGPQSALVAMDARSREVLSLVGSYEAVMGGLDRASYAHRQPGSSFKAFVYSYALHSRRFTPASVLDLEKQGEPYRESVRAAIAASDNNAAHALLRELGAQKIVDWARSFGITSPMQPTLSLALGAYELTPIELVAAYAVFPGGGEYAPPQLIRRIVGPDGAALPLPAGAPRKRVMSTAEAYLTTSLLHSVIEVGTAKRARSLNRPLAGKTGTTNQAKDTWFVGYSTDIVAGIWVGYDDAVPLGAGEAGNTTALPGWIQFMKQAHEKRPATDFPRPPEIVTLSVDPATGLLPYPGQTNAVEEEFLSGTEPSEVASPDAGLADGGAPLVVDDEALQGRAAPPHAFAAEPAKPRR